MNRPSAIIEAKNLTVGYRADRPVLRDISFRLQPGITVLFGRNGAGKTTLMRTLVSVLPRIAGELTIRAQSTGYLAHRLAVAEGLTARQNLNFWHSIYSSYSPHPPHSVDECIADFSLAKVIDKKLQKLSRGQRQRVDLARLFMARPDFLVLDEPLTGLDPVYAAEIRDMLMAWSKERSILYSTHNIADAIGVADHAFVVHGGRLTELTKNDINEAKILQLLGDDDE